MLLFENQHLIRYSTEINEMKIRQNKTNNTLKQMKSKYS